MNSNTNLHPNVKTLLFSENEIKERVQQIGREITKDYQGSKELVLIGILKGSFMFMSDLVRAIDLPDTLVTLDFMSISSYGASTTSSGVVKINMDLKEAIEGKDVIVVEDIVDSGLTLKHLLELLQSRKPKSLATSVLLRKKEGLKVEVPVKYIGFDIPMVFIIGYGLDFAERYRELPYLGELKEECYKH
ncbi:hypoxanthine phosphoribosyltransferase [Heterostelium album PN500]|uniref:Hypoxanthine phosphoribosyltransferase n=1 Tax=Heterostelium pallidum (strain ATCC 26659 / Pp 5 / PN500) TaxID=670386 RepID=D3AYL6_HETP5|nr:hypoxanthine phosphoribosyltransferase [Heterostelium album PN500]EFA86043.1 hypoxanthine phosphoribosyltransferase [Heterostelium album PN500]|eukprot:XP_020438149.1 hypoxanthine phosphoribosyltransferase [Heterostelium album PN500]